MTRSKAVAISVAGFVVFLVEVFVEWPFEGPVVLKFDRQHGVHVSDLVTLGLLVVLLLWTWRPARQPASSRETAATSPER